MSSLGRQRETSAAARRVVSLLPAATEILCAVGGEDRLVGRSHECDFPVAVRSLPPCTRTSVDPDGSSREIHEQVRNAGGVENARAALSLYEVDSEELARLQPDLVLTQSQCEVCAVSLRDVEGALHEHLGQHPRILSLEPNDLADVWGDIERVAEAIGEGPRGRRKVGDLQRRTEAVRERAMEARDVPTVACLEWLDPLMAAGSWIPTLVEIAGGRPAFGASGRKAPWISFETLREADPDIVVAMPCGMSLPQARGELDRVQTDAWRELRAVRAGRVAVADAQQFFSRPGPRLVESIEMLAAICHPDLFGGEQCGQGWAWH